VKGNLGVVAFQSLGHVRLAYCQNPHCTAANTPDLGVGGDHISMVIGADGQPLIAHASGGELKVIHCKGFECGDPPDVTTLDASAGVNVTDTSITLGADGLGLIAYLDLAHIAVRVTHCALVACTAWLTSPVDNSGTDADPSITVGNDGRGLISYWRQVGGPGGAFHVAHCNDLGCSTSASFQVDFVGGATSVGHRSSITIGADGLGVMSYRYENEQSMRVAHCSNVDCSSSVHGTVLPTATFAPGYTVGDWTAITLANDGLPLVATYAVNPNPALSAPVLLHCSNAFCTDYFRRR